MKKLSDFKPLSRLALPDLDGLDCSGLVLIVGPNSSGKSQLLQDVYRRLIGETRKLVVANDIRVEKPDLKPFLRCLEEEGYIHLLEDEAGTKKIRARTMFLGSGEPISETTWQQAEAWYNAYNPGDPNSDRSPSSFLNYFGRLFVTGLFLQRRLDSLQPAQIIDFDNQPPQHDLHALLLNEEASTALSDEVLRSFGQAVWPDKSRGSHVCLKISDEGQIPSAEDRHSHTKMAAFRSIETEGDGMRAYLATCVALLLGNRPVCVIDEPELCLHPPQAYNLGRFIGVHGANPQCVTLVATHSSHLLRGVIQTAPKVQIVRLTQRDHRFSAHLVPASELKDALKRPALRGEAILDGIFSQAIVIVEADGDRLVYQTTWETVSEEYRFDLHFSTVGGTGGIAYTCGLYRSLRIPLAVVADLDMLADSARMADVLGRLVDDAITRTLLLTECERIRDAVRLVPPTKNSADVLTELQALCGSPMDWSKKHDIDLRSRLRVLAGDLDRMRRLKRGGVSSYPGKLGTDMRSLLDRLCVHGLFLVPVGELEEWLPQEDVAVSKSDKRAWSNAAAQAIQSSGKQGRPLWVFVRAVAAYLDSQLRNRQVPAVGLQAASTEPAESAVRPGTG